MDYTVVGRVRDFLELKHGRNGVRGAEIPKVRHLGLKRRRFVALEFFFFFLTQGTTQNDNVLDKLK